MPCCCSSNVQAAWILGIIAIILNLVLIFPFDVGAKVLDSRAESKTLVGAICAGVISALIQGTVIVVLE